jgi:hypothetical protein
MGGECGVGLIFLIPFTRAKRASSFEVASCSMIRGSAPLQEKRTESEDEEEEGFNSRLKVKD